MSSFANRSSRASCVALAMLTFSLSATLHAQAPAEPAPAPEQAPAPAPDAAPPPAPEATTPPQLVMSTQPVYPESEHASGRHPTVVLKVTVFADGTLGDIIVEHSAGSAFDEAAMAAVKTWTFAPARHGEETIASRVGVAVHFELPELATQNVVSAPDLGPVAPHEHVEAAPVPPAANTPEGEEALPELTAHAHAEGSLYREDRGAADLHLSGTILHAAPAQDSAELLTRAPGLVVAKIEGDGVAPRIMLRGFDADHGQDIELSVGGVPVNQPAHIHGQGYADLGFLIPETVRSLHVTEGVYDPRQGDFAVAGSAAFELGVEQRGIRLSTGYGSFNTFRELALYAPPGLDPGTFAAVVFKKTRGFGQNRASTSGAAVGQMAVGSGPMRTTLHASVYGMRARTANVLRRDDIDAGRVDFHDVYPEATARAQAATAQRVQLSVHTHYHGERGENAELLAYWVANLFSLRANYTGFAESSVQNPTWTGRGDLIDQRNDDRAAGFKARYRTPEQKPFSFVTGFLELGMSGRFARVEQAQDLVQAPQNVTWDRRIDASVGALDVGGYFDIDSTWFDLLHLRGGLRADLLSYQVNDRLANTTPPGEVADHLPGARRNAAGMALGPRAVAEVEVLPALSVLAAYGEGYRSPLAFIVEDGKSVPFTKVRSGDLGLKTDLGTNDEVTLRLTGYLTRLDDDIAFEADEGRLESIGATRRLGGVLYGAGQPLPWLTTSASVTYVHAALEERPEAEPGEPRPRKLVPYVPPVVVRADLSAVHALFDVGSSALEGRASAGYSYWAPRPLPFGGTSAGVSLLDAELGVAYAPFTLTLSCFNVLDAEYAALELSYASSWDPASVTPGAPARHIMAGAPRTFFGTLDLAW